MQRRLAGPKRAVSCRRGPVNSGLCWREPRNGCVVMRAACCLGVLLAAAWSASPAPGQALLTAEPMYAAPGVDGPPLEYFDLDAWTACCGPLSPRTDWSWQLLPEGILYPAYLANTKETRLGTQIFSSQGD